MLLLWSFGNRVSKKDKFVNLKCGNCNSAEPKRLMVTYKDFSLFFIPIVKWGKKYYVECEKCGSALEISKEEYKTLMKDPTNLPIRLKSINVNIKNDDERNAETKAYIDFVISKIDKEEVLHDEEKLSNLKKVLKEQLYEKYPKDYVDNAVEKYIKELR